MENEMPAPTAWRPLEEYPGFMRPIVQYMWEHRPPLNPSQFATLTGVRRQLLSAYLNSPTDANLAPEPDVVRRFARAMGRPTSELMALANHGDAEDPFLDRVGATDFLLAEVDRLRASLHAAPDEIESAKRILRALRSLEEDWVNNKRREAQPHNIVVKHGDTSQAAEDETGDNPIADADQG
jgi:hypothetical protein